MLDKSLTDNYPRDAGAPNWIKYRLSKTNMLDLRDVSSHWAYTCAYDTRGFSTTDYILSRFNETDPLGFNQFNTFKCRLYEYFNVNGDMCENCHIETYQSSSHTLHYNAQGVQRTDDGCDGLQLSVSYPTCSTGPVQFFGAYDCYSELHSCTASAQATTQLWFITRNN